MPPGGQYPQGPNNYTTQLPQGSPYANPLDQQPGQPLPNNTQYDFINAEQINKKKGLFGKQTPTAGNMNSSEGFRKRLIIGVAGFVVVGIVIAIVAALILGSGGSGNTQDMINVAADQTEIIRVADLGVKSARGNQAQNFATTTSMTIQTDRKDVLAAVKNHRTKVNDKLLATSKNAKTDAALQVASQNNRFDEDFTTILTTMLTNYQKKVKAAYDATSNVADQKVLSSSYTHAAILLGQPLPSPQSNPTTTPTPPAPTPTPTANPSTL